MIKQVAAAVALSLSLVPLAQGQSTVPSTVFTQNVSDIWWNPSESGWGIQLNQTGNVVFATLYVYGQNSQPTWFTAILYAQGTTNGQGQSLNNGVYTGTVYSTTGPYFGLQAFNPASVTTTAVGTMTLQIEANGMALLTYTINGVTVNKTIQRQTLVNANLTGTFQAFSTLTASNCTNAANNGTVIGSSTFTVTDTGNGTNQIVWTDPNGGACTFNGLQTQNGAFSSFNGATFSCSNGNTGTLNFSNLSTSNGMFSGTVSGGTNANGCTLSGAFSGLNRQAFP